MELIHYAEKSASPLCTWSDDGLSIIIRSPHEFVKHLVPKFFRGGGKFASFQRKLYRWGFRVISHYWKRELGGDEIVVYQAENFQRDCPQLVQEMSSVTARTTRRKETLQSLNKDAFPSQLASFRANGRGQEKGQCDLSLVNVPSTEKKAIDDSMASLTAALKIALFTESENEFVSLLKKYDLDPNPIM
jgi:hypothetical protein